MSSSGLIYAVIVGAWAAYLVPMWLRRQDELNEARPTERFSTAIRLLSGRAGMERRYAKDLQERASDDGEPDGKSGGAPEPETEPVGAQDAAGSTDAVDVRSFAVSATTAHSLRTREVHEAGESGAAEADEVAESEGAEGTSRAEARRERADREAPASRPERQRPAAAARPALSAAERARRSKVLARRRRTTMGLFLAFTLSSVVAAVGGLAFLWAPAVPAVLLSAYIAHLRAHERRRFAFTMDQRRAEAAAKRLRERRSPAAGRAPHATGRTSRPPGRGEAGLARGRGDAGGRGRGDAGAAREATVEGDREAVVEKSVAEAAPAPASPHTAGRRALVEQTDHAEWVDQQRERGPAQGDSWDPVPVPLPTYVTAPVAPRATGGVDLGAPDAWSSARSSSAEPTPEPAPRRADSEAADQPAARRPAGRRARERGRTPLFDQYADEDRPRAANE
ncbi:gephyrin-like molybdotransferase receptor GlpR [Streptomyces pathocidini]|uniref:Gephyrin-like molybdotransferase receptor GlpR n=1 Tax=Streptomyces pathocidini TaxID=1650571 RepID=A0ABW7UVN0_9ACTN